MRSEHVAEVCRARVPTRLELNAEGEFSYLPFIYGLCADDGIIRYVGCTSWRPQHRLLVLMSESRCGGKRPVHTWIRSVVATKGKLRAVVISEVGSFAAEAREIERRLAAGEPLTNAVSKPRRKRKAVAA